MQLKLLKALAYGAGLQGLNSKGKLTMRYEEIEGDGSDIIAVLKYNGVEVIYTEVEDELIDDYYECISWHDKRMVISIASSFLREEVDEYVVKRVNQILGPTSDIFDQDRHEESAQERTEITMKVFSEALKNITTDIMMTSDPEKSSLDLALEQILESED